MTPHPITHHCLILSFFICKLARMIVLLGIYGLITIAYRVECLEQKLRETSLLPILLILPL